MDIQITFLILAGIFAILTVGSMFSGLISMGRVRDDSREKSNKMMQARILFQGLTIACLAIAMISG